ncbi:alpha/beta fold hydrolase BchO [Sphingomonas sp.]
MSLSLDRDGRNWPHRDASRFVRAGRIEWHVQEMGEGPVALLIHGTGAATHSWRGVMPLLADRFRIVAIDLPGHGFTRGRPVGGMSIEAIRDALAELIEAMDVAPALLVGHSAGTALAVALVADRAVHARAIVGVGAAILPFPGLAARLFPTLAKLLFANPFAPYLFAQMARAPGEVERFLKRSTGSTPDAADVAAYTTLFQDAGHCGGAIAMMASWDLEALAAMLTRIDAPVLLLHGERDAAIPLAAMRGAVERLARAELIALAGLGHLAHEEQPGLVARHIAAFADRMMESEPA